MIPIPWKVEKGHGCPESRPWACVNETNGHVAGCHPTRESGLKQSAALYANTNETKAASSTPTAGGYGIPQPINSSIALTGQGSTLTDHPGKGSSVATPDWTVEQGHGCPSTAPWAVVDSDTGEVYCCSRSEASARAQAAVAWDSDAGQDAADMDPQQSVMHYKEGGARSQDGDGEVRATPPTDVHASAHNAHDIKFLHDVAGHIVGSLTAAKAVQSKGIHPEVAALAASVLTTRGHDMTAITNLGRRVGVAIGGGAAAAATATGTSGHGQGGGNAYGQNNSATVGGEDRADPRGLVESVLRGLSGKPGPRDDLSDAEFLYGFTAQLREAQEAIGTLGSDNAEVKAYAEKAAAVLAEQVVGARRTAWKLSGGKTPAALTNRSATSAVVTEFVAAQADEPPGARTKRARADRELLESVLFGSAVRATATKSKSKSGGNKSPYGNVAYADPGYQSDNKKRYPIDTKEHVKAAWSYINQKGNAAKYSSSQVASIKGRIKAAAKKFGVTISDQSNSSNLDAGVIRAVSHAQELREDRSGDGLGLLTGHFSVFDTWYRVDSMREGTFLERVAPTAFDDTIRADRDRMRVLFDHGFDPQLGNKVLGSIRELRADDAGAYYAVDLFDTSYNRDLLPGLKKGVYGASMRMRVLDDKWDDKPGESDHNPEGIAERTIRKTSVAEFGPVTFPASPSATATVRSMTDYFYERRGLLVPAAEVRSSLADDGWTADEITEWESHLDTALDSDVSTADNGAGSTNFPGRSDTQSVDGGDSETESRSDRVSTHVDEFSDRIDALWFRDMKMRHASAYQRTTEGKTTHA